MAAARTGVTGRREQRPERGADPAGAGVAGAAGADARPTSRELKQRGRRRGPA